jgi:hypothetical protein
MRIVEIFPVGCTVSRCATHVRPLQHSGCLYMIKADPPLWLDWTIACHCVGKCKCCCPASRCSSTVLGGRQGCKPATKLLLAANPFDMLRHHYVAALHHWFHATIVNLSAVLTPWYCTPAEVVVVAVVKCACIVLLDRCLLLSRTAACHWTGFICFGCSFGLSTRTIKEPRV